MNTNLSKKQIAVLIDPDKTDANKLQKIVLAARNADIDFFLVGGSLLLKNKLEETVVFLKKHSKKSIYFQEIHHK